LPVVALAETSSMSTIIPVGFLTVTTTPVFGPGAGETAPVMTMGCTPVYEGAFVVTVTV
jgi:hypothetical protein